MEYGHGGDIYTYQGVTDFSTNINPFGPSEAVIEAAKAGLLSAGQYPDSRCRRLCERLEEKTGITREWFLPGNGAADLIFSLVLAEKPKKAVIPIPTFSEYSQALQTVGCEEIEYVLKPEEDFRLTEDVLPVLTEEVDMVFLCSPSNPAGQTVETELLFAIAKRCEENRIRLVIDACFSEFLEHPEKLRLYELSARYPQAIVLYAFTKMHAIPGLRLGYGVSSDKGLLERMQRVRQPWSVSVVAEAAGIAALDEKERVAMTRRYIQKERAFLQEELQKLGMQVIPSEVNYLLFYSEKELFETMRKCGFLIRDCANYRGLQRGWYRIAVRTNEENRELLCAMEEALR